MQELPGLVPVVHDVQFPELIQEGGFDLVARLDVVVVVRGDVEGSETALARRSSEREDIGRCEGDVLRQDRIFARPGGHQIESDSNDSVGAAKDLAAHEAHRCGHLDRCLRAQIEHRAEEEDRCIEVLPRLSEVDMIDTFDHVRVIVFGGAELTHPSRLRSSLGTEEHLRTVGRSNTDEGLLARSLRPEEPRARRGPSPVAVRWRDH